MPLKAGILRVVGLQTGSSHLRMSIDAAENSLKSRDLMVF